MANDKAQALYNQLTSDGYELGDFNTFNSKLSNPEKAKALHSTITKDGYDVGDFNTFYSKVAQVSGVAAPEKPNFAIVPELKPAMEQQTPNPISTNEANQVIYGSVPGATKIGDVSIMPIGKDYQQQAAQIQPEEASFQGVNAKAPQLEIQTVVPETEQTGQYFDYANSKQEDKGYWSSTAGDFSQAVFAGAADLVGNTIGFLNNLPSYATGLPTPDKTDAQRIFNEGAEYVRRKSSDNKDKNFVDYWKNGDYGKAAEDIWVKGGESAPLILSIILTGGVSGTTLAGATSMQSQYDQLNGNTQMSEDQKRFNAMMYGTIDAVSELLGSVPVANMIRKTATRVGKEATAKAIEKTFTTAIDKVIAKSGTVGKVVYPTMGEGLEEAAAQFGQNIVGYSTGEKKEFKPFEGVFESMVYGMGGGVNSSVISSGAIVKQQAESKKNFENADRSLVAMLSRNGFTREDVAEIKQTLLSTDASNRNNVIVAISKAIPGAITNDNGKVKFNPEVGKLFDDFYRTSENLKQVSSKFNQQVQDETARQGEESLRIQTETEKANNILSESANVTTGEIQSIELVTGEKGVVNGGELVYKEDGSVDKDATGIVSFKEITGVDTEGNPIYGEPKVLDLRLISNLGEAKPVEQAQQEAGVQIEQLAVEQEVDAFYPTEEEIWDVNGKSISTFPDEVSGQIMAQDLDENGFQVNEPYPLSDQQYADISGKKLPESIKMTEQQPQNEVVAPEVSNDMTENAPVVDEAPQYPLNKKGEVDFDAMTVEQTYNYLKETEGDDVADEGLQLSLKAIQKKIQENINSVQTFENKKYAEIKKATTIQEQAKVRAKHKATSTKLAEERTMLDQQAAEIKALLPEVEVPVQTQAPVSNLRPEIAQLQKEQSIPVAEVQEAPVSEIEQPTIEVREKPQWKGTPQWTRRLNNLGDYMSLEDYVLRSIAGGTVFKWSDSINKGLGEELGLTDSKSELEWRKSIVDKNGITPQELANSIWDEYGEERNEGRIPGMNQLDYNDVLDIVIETAGSVQNKTHAVEKAESLRSKYDLSEEDYTTFQSIAPEEYAYLDEIPDDILESYLGITNFTPEQLDFINQLHDNYYGQTNTEPANSSTSERNQGPESEETAGQRSEQQPITHKEEQEPANLTTEDKFRGSDGQESVQSLALLQAEQRTTAESSALIDELAYKSKSADKFIENLNTGVLGLTSEEAMSIIGLSKDNTAEQNISIAKEYYKEAKKRHTEKLNQQKQEADTLRAEQNVDAIEKLALQQTADMDKLIAQRDTQELDEYIAEQAHNTNPTAKQKETGIYDKARVSLQGHNITIETLKGTDRTGTDSNGKDWAVTMNNHYGELDGTIGYDGDAIDVFVGPSPKGGQIFVIDQVSTDGSFDESKVMLGFDTAEEAKAAYMSNYEAGWQGFGSITPAGENFKTWLYDGKKQRKPFAEYKETPEAITPQSTEISKLNEEKKQIKASKDKLIKELSARNGLFGDTKADPNDLFGGEGNVDTNAAKLKLDEYNNRTKEINRQISELKKNAETGAKESELQEPLFQILGSPRNSLPKVRGGWTKAKIIKELKDIKKNYSSGYGKFSLIKGIASFENAQDLRNHLFYHGTGGGVYGSLYPSITISEREAEQNGGGGYGERYYAVSVSKSKRKAASFSGQSRGISIYPVFLNKEAKVIDRPDIQDSNELEDIIEELWNDGVDAVRLGDWNDGYSEQELAILNPMAISTWSGSERHAVYGMKFTDILEKTDEELEQIIDTAKSALVKLDEWKSTNKMPSRPNLIEYKIGVDSPEFVSEAQKKNREIISERKNISDEYARLIRNEKENLINGIAFQLDTNSIIKNYVPLRNDFASNEEKHADRTSLVREVEGAFGFQESYVPTDREDFVTKLKQYGTLSERNKSLVLSGTVGGVAISNDVIINAMDANTEKSLAMTILHENTHHIVDNNFEMSDLDSAKEFMSELEYIYLNNKERSSYNEQTKAKEVMAYAAQKLLNNNSIEDIVSGSVDYSNIHEAILPQIKKIVNIIQDENNIYSVRRRSGINKSERSGVSRVRTSFGKRTYPSRPGKIGRSGMGSGEEIPATININGTDRPTRNSNGSLIHSTEEGIRNFYEWFGNSKVVDESGRPLVVYHTTNADFTVFSKKKSKDGFFFSPNESRLFDYNKSKTDAYYLSLQNPSHELFKNDVNELSSKGYDGIMDYGHAKKINSRLYEIIAFSPTQIKSATGNSGAFNPDNADIRFQIDRERLSKQNGFYSTVEKALLAISQEKGTKEQFKQMLLKNGAKQAEMDWMGFDELPEKLTKADIQNWIDENRIEVKEVVKGKTEWTEIRKGRWERKTDRETPTGHKNSIGRIVINEVIGKYYATPSTTKFTQVFDTLEQAQNHYDKIEGLSGNTKFSQYVLPGGENYKELLLTMPSRVSKPLTKYAYAKSLGYSDLEFDNLPREEQTKIWNDWKKEADKQSSNDVADFQSGHYEEPNILAHIRFNERTVNGERVLFIEEIQSDWAQKGKKEGFKIGNKENVVEDNTVFWVYNTNGKFGFVPKTEAKTAKDALEYSKSHPEIFINETGKEGVPDMPFKKTDQWVNLAVRRMMRYAAENGFDRIAWTNGEQQANRYDLAKQVDKIEITQGKIDSEPIDSYRAKTYKDGKILEDQDYIQFKDLEGMFGKEIAVKIQNGERVFEGEGLKVGGQGMKAFYDAIVPSAMSKLGKPFGAKVESIAMPLETSNDFEIETDLYADGTGVAVLNNTGDRIAEFDTEKEANDFILSKTASTQQSIPVTESMKKTALEGMPLFQILEENPLVVIHNTTSGKLIKSDRVGGIAMPSLAVTKPGLPFESYGEISLIGDKNIIDPKNKLNKVYPADAYTPRYPTIEYNVKNAKPIETAIVGMPSDIARTIKYSLPRSIEDAGDDYLYENTDMIIIFAHSKGADIFNAEKNSNPKELVDYIRSVKAYDFLDISNNAAVMEDLQRLYSKTIIAEKLDFYKRHGLVDENGNVSTDFIKQKFNDIKTFLRKEGKTDYYATRDAARDYVKENNLQAELKEFASKMYDEMDVKERIYKGRSRSGSPQYTAHTVENAVKHMKSKESVGEQGISGGLGKLRSKLLPLFKSVSDIKKSADKIVTNEELKAKSEQIYNEYHEYYDRLKQFYKWTNNESIVDFYSNLEDEIVRLLKHGTSESFNQLPIELHEDLKSFAQKAAQLQTEYFEAKPARAVSLSEFTAAVIPEGTSEKVVSILKNAGLDVRTYTNNRAEVVARTAHENNVQFQIIGEQGASNLDEYDDSSIRLDNLRVAKEMGKGGKERKVLFVDNDGKNIVYDDGNYRIAVNDPEKATYITLWHKEEVKGKEYWAKRGYLSTNETNQNRGDNGEYKGKYLSISSVEIDKENRGSGYGKKLYKALENFAGDDVKGIYSYLPNRVNKREVPTIYKRMNAKVVDGDHQFVNFNKTTFTPQEIRLATGWERGVDGKWRYEVPDIEIKKDVLKELEKNQYLANQDVNIGNVTYRKEDNGLYTVSMRKKDATTTKEFAEYKNLSVNELIGIIDNKEISDKILAGEGGESFIGENWDDAKELKTDFTTFITGGLPLSNVIEDNGLFKAYPALKDIIVVINKRQLNGAAYITKEDSQKVIEIGMVWNGTRSNLIHEIQHAIQEIEGFAKGGNLSSVDTYLSNYDRDVKSYTNNVEMISDWLVRAANEGDSKELDNIDGSTKSIVDFINSKPYYTETEKNFANSVLKQESEVLKEYTKVKKITKHSYYNSLAGEVEARNASARMNMTEDERKYKLLSETADVASEDQIVLMDSNGISQSVPQKPIFNGTEPFTEVLDKNKKYYEEMQKWQKDNLETIAAGESVDIEKLNTKVNSTMSKLWEGLADSQKPVKKWQEYLNSQGVDISDNDNYYMRVTMVESRIEQAYKEYETNYTDPFVKTLKEFKKLGLSYDNLADYAKLKHADEYTEHVMSKRMESQKWSKDRINLYNVQKTQDADVVKKYWEEWAEKRILNLKQEGSDYAQKVEQINKKRDKNIEEVTIDLAGKKVIEERIGMPAEQYISEVEGIGGALIPTFWEQVRKLSEFSLEEEVRSGIRTRKSADDIKDTFEYYVPLKGHAAPTAEQAWDYSREQGDFFVSAVKQGKGRKSESGDPFSYIVSAARSSIGAAERNILLQTILRTAEKDTTGSTSISKTWFIKTGEETDEFGNAKAIFEIAPEVTYEENDTQESYNAKIAANEEKMKAMAELKEAYQGKIPKLDIGVWIKPVNVHEHEIQVRRNGDMYTVRFNTAPRIPQAINKVNFRNYEGFVGKAFEQVGNTTRFLAATKTMFRPTFIFITNPLRDIHAGINLAFIDEGPAFAANVFAKIPVAANALTKRMIGKSDLNNKYDRMLNNYLLNGGKTGISKILELKQVEVDLRGKVDKKKHPLQSAKNVYQSISEITENQVRLAVYYAAIDKGYSSMKATSMAKEATINFDRKGNGRNGLRELKSLHAFVNVGFQALDNIYTKSTQSKETKRRALISITLNVAAGMFAVAAISSVIAKAFGKDDEWIEDFGKLSSYERNSNFLIWTPWGILKYPLAQEFRVYHALGMDAMMFYHGKQTGPETALNLISGLSSLVPYNPVESTINMNLENASQIPTAVLGNTVDLLSPITQLAVNRNFMGGSIYKENQPEEKPGHAQVKKDKKGNAFAPESMIDFSEFVNRVTGGNNVKSGVSFNPDVMNHLLNGYLTGLYQQPLTVIESVYNMDAKEFIPTAVWKGRDDIKNRTSGLNEKFYEEKDANESDGYFLKGYKTELEKLKADFKNKEIDKVTYDKLSSEYKSEIERIESSDFYEKSGKIKVIKELEDKLDETKGEEQNDIQSKVIDLKQSMIDGKSLGTYEESKAMYEAKLKRISDYKTQRVLGNKNIDKDIEKLNNIIYTKRGVRSLHSEITRIEKAIEKATPEQKQKLQQQVQKLINQLP